MNNIKYEVVREEYSQNRIAYGIAVCESGLPIETISDISDKYEAVVRLVRTCNSLNLSQDHIREVVEDFLNE